MARKAAFAAWPADLAAEPEGGFTATFPDIVGVTWGKDRAEALARAEDLLDEAVLGRMAHNEDVAPPSAAKGRPLVRLSALTAAKLEAYHAMREAGLDKRQLAARLGWEPDQIGGLFDSRDAFRLDHVEAVLAALGRRLVVTSEVK